MKRNSFWTFIFSLIPGAGEMYLGKMRRGTSIMLMFWGIILLCAFLNVSFLVCILPVIWAYSFFDVLNLNRKNDEELEAIPDDFIFDLDGMFKKDWNEILKRRHGFVGIILILLGIYALFSVFALPILGAFDLPYAVFNIINNIPSLFVGIAIIVLGCFLVRGGGKSADKDIENDNNDYQEFRGDDDEQQ